jgi:hypothetical protein
MFITGDKNILKDIERFKSNLRNLNVLLIFINMVNTSQKLDRHSLLLS